MTNMTNAILRGKPVLRIRAAGRPVLAIFATALPLLAFAKTYCNPMDLDYRFAVKQFADKGKAKPFREAADPELLRHQGAYYLFASHSGGYWKSSDLVKWSFIPARGLPIERWDPSVRLMNGELAYTSSNAKRFYRAVDIDKGIWEAYPQPFLDVFAPSFLIDDDGRAYVYGNKSGKDRKKPLLDGEEFDPKTHRRIGEKVGIYDCDPENLGWERRGDTNEKTERPYNEGVFMSKHRGRYYLQYGSPGTEFDGHCEAMLVSERPLGPFRLQTSNPFVYRADGFATGIGGGAVSVDEFGNWWHVGNTKVKVRHIFERRLSLDPVFFDDDGDMYCPALWGDYPREMPRRKLKGPEEALPKWMLLSCGCRASASSADEKHPAKFAVDEQIGTWWAAQGAEPGEWLAVDLGRAATIASVQVNFADEGCEGFYGRERAVDYRYAVETSDDGKDWRRRVDVSKGLGRDATSPYHELGAPVRARHVRVVNLGCNCPKFSVSGLRVFGRDDGPAPAAPQNVRVVRDGCRATVRWDAVPGAEGYAVMFGFKPKFLYLGRRVRGACTLDLTMLNAKSAYYLEVVAFNGAGLSTPSARLRVE